MNFLKQKKLIIAIITVVLVGLLGIGFLLLKSSGNDSDGPIADEFQNIKQISPEDIGLSLELTSDKKNVVMTITKLEGVASVEYELSYDATERVEGETVNVPKGALSSTPISVKGKSKIETKIFLGTCSAVCREDKVTSDIKAVVKVNYENGEIAAAETTIPFDSSDED